MDSGVTEVSSNMDCKQGSIPIQGHEYDLAKVLAKCPILGDKWKELAYALRIDEDLQIYKQEESCKLRLVKMLARYISKNGLNATFDKLVAVLQDEEFMSAADSVQLYLETQEVSLEPPSRKSKSRLNSSTNCNLSPNSNTQDISQICSGHRFECEKCKWIFKIQRSSGIENS